MGARIQTVTTEDGEVYATLEEAAEATDDGAVLFVEHVPGFEPHSPQSVILALVEEIERLRGKSAA
jgi:hypothetical protein